MMKSPLPIVETSVETLLQSAKWAYTTRHIPKSKPTGLERQFEAAQAGDLMLARVQRIRSHSRLQTRDGYHSTLYPDDLIVATLGARYATDQFEGIAECTARKPADLLAGGGVIGRMRTRNAGVKSPTTLHVLGRLTDATGDVLNLRRFAVSPTTHRTPKLVIGVIGTAMNSGKTSAASWLIHGFERAGHRTAGIKLTGTGSFGDPASYWDAGASCVLDFTDAGMASTYMAPMEKVLRGFDRLLNVAHGKGCEVAVVELADSVSQVETAALLSDRRATSKFNAYVLAASDALSALGAAAWLSERHVRPMAVSGTITKAPLSVDELSRASDIPILSRETLGDPATASAFLTKAQPLRKARSA